MKPHIGVLGCGWLGFPLAKRFISMDFRVSGTTTTKANLDILGNEGIVPYYVELHNEGVKGSLINFLKGHRHPYHQCSSKAKSNGGRLFEPDDPIIRGE